VFDASVSDKQRNVILLLIY